LIFVEQECSPFVSVKNNNFKSLAQKHLFVWKLSNSGKEMEKFHSSLQAYIVIVAAIFPPDSIQAAP
jgi:hypothetical protein